ncbi:MAG TPA: hypothetical protein VHH15_22075 [Actinophytocola sp.]|nr:hypothetical protein [Actinophytocola sp.]
MATRPGIKPLHGVPRKVWQIVHIVSAVGWLGIEVCVLGLTAIGLTADDPGTVRTAHDAAVLLADTFFLPATVLMFVSGLVLGLGTRWGLFRYYWVTAKLAIGCALLVAGTYTLEATVREVSDLAAADALPTGAGPSVVGMLSVIAALTLFAAVLSVAKPWGRIPWRTRSPQTQES